MENTPNINLSSQSKIIGSLISPLKEPNQFNTPIPHSEKHQILSNSPFKEFFQTPFNKLDFAPFLQSNGLNDTPLSSSKKCCSPFINTIGSIKPINQNLSSVQKKLFSPFSGANSFTPKVLFHSETEEPKDLSKIHLFSSQRNLNIQFGINEPKIPEKYNNKENEDKSEKFDINNSHICIETFDEQQFSTIKSVFKKETFSAKKVLKPKVNLLEDITDHNEVVGKKYSLNTFNANLIEMYQTEADSQSEIDIKEKKSKKNNINSHIPQQEIGIISTPKCKCSKSKCLKLYCDCFSKGRYCNDCLCVNCFNTDEHEIERKKVYNQIISKNPKALQKIKSTKRSWICKCKNSNCLKNYCDCHQNGKSCSSKCKCVNCLNKVKIKRIRHNCLRPKRRRKLMAIKEETEENVPKTIEANFTPQKKNYRYFQSDYKGGNSNGLSTAALTQLSFSNEHNKRKRSPGMWKKLNLDIDDNCNGLFK